jgi:two-component system cell cycle sensor histidine kinase/response regulator CckA
MSTEHRAQTGWYVMDTTLNDIVQDARARLRRLAGPKIDVALDLCDRPAVVDADPADLHEVLRHLCENAREAMPAGGSIVIETRQIDLLPVTRGGGARSFSRLSVTDTGCGIPPLLQRRIFEPSFTTKPRRAGLGLTIVRTVVGRHGGFLDFSTAVGAGTVFHVYLPGEPAGARPAGGCIGAASAYTWEQ